MKEFTFTVEDESGIHARPAGMIVNCAKKYKATVCVKTPEKEADGKRLLSVMSLGAVKSTPVTFVIDGEDEAAAARDLEALCKEQLGHGRG